MVVDFEVTRTPSYTVAAILKIGPYREDNLRSEFGELVAWAKQHRLRTGKWIMYEHDGPNSRRPGNQRRWEACLEIRGKAKPEGRISDFRSSVSRAISAVSFARTNGLETIMSGRKPSSFSATETTRFAQSRPSGVRCRSSVACPLPFFAGASDSP